MRWLFASGTKTGGARRASLVRGASVMHSVVLLAVTKHSVRGGATQVRTMGDMIWPEGLSWRWAVSPRKASDSVPGQLTYRPGLTLNCCFRLGSQDHALGVTGGGWGAAVSAACVAVPWSTCRCLLAAWHIVVA